MRDNPLRYYVVSNNNRHMPVGMVVPTTITSMPKGNLIPCKGQKLSIADYPELYQVIGESYSSNSHLRKPLSSFKRFLKRLGFPVKETLIPNPNFDGTFVLPDLNPYEIEIIQE